MGKNNDDVPPTSVEQFYDTIFGADYDVDDELANQILASHYINSSELIDEFKLRVQAELRRDFEVTGKVNKPLEAALKSMRQQQEASKPAAIEAESWIKGLLSGATTSTSGTQVRFSFHKQKEGQVSASDKTILDDLERELDKK